MKKFLIVIFSLVALWFAFDTLYYHCGFYIDLRPNKEVTTFIKTEGNKIYLNDGDGYEEFEIRGVDMGSAEPGHWATDFAIDYDTYYRWFGMIKDMGANTVRIYTIQSDTFYNAFYDFNKDRDDPLYLLHGVWVNDYAQNSRNDGYHEDFKADFTEDCKIMLDVIHGNRKLFTNEVTSAGHGTYKKDISSYVIGYIIGVEWEDPVVAYTNDKYADDPDKNSYSGKYFYTSEDGSPFEAMIASVGDELLRYEATRYKTQKLLAFSNWPTTDPFDYPEEIIDLYGKIEKVDAEHIKETDNVISGQFASYHIYPYFPDYLHWTEDLSAFGVNKEDFIEESGEFNAYKAYLHSIASHHTMPVIISEFGVPTGRGMAHRDTNTGRNQGKMNEDDQAAALIRCYNDIIDAGCAGSCIFSWQDEWFKRTWNTNYSVNLLRTAYWSDYETNEQFYGLLTFDPGNERSVCYVNGDISEWSDDDIVSVNGDMSVSMKYDEQFIYFRVNKKDLDIDNDKIFIPIDTTPKSGTNYCENFSLRFNRGVDFLIVINGKNESRIMVNEPYESLRSTYSSSLYDFDTYIKDNMPDLLSPKFLNVEMILEISTFVRDENGEVGKIPEGTTFETGKLRYGNADPDSENFDSLADFISEGDDIEIRIPWYLLNFSDASKMQIHDNYYGDYYGVDFISIDEMYVGVMTEGVLRCSLDSFPLEGWGENVTYHERLKKGYYAMQSIWNTTD